jgi:hypothetical protein
MLSGALQSDGYRKNSYIDVRDLILRPGAETTPGRIICAPAV